jgi:hypothetical protein
MRGWIRLHRKIKNHWLWQDPEKFQRWITMLLEVNYSEGKMPLGNQLITVKRGSSTNSLRTWSDLFGCGTKATANFFELLESDGMITRKVLGKGKHSTTLINITNYEDYQTSEETLTDTLTATQAQREGHTIKEGKEGEERKKNNVSFTFDEFWEKYPIKVGKKKCSKKWEKLTKKQKEEIKNTIDDFIAYKQFPGWKHPNPETYLNSERWEDELSSTENHITVKSPTDNLSVI